MNENQPEVMKQASKEEQLKAIEQVRDLFARAHDYVAQAQYPGHMSMKIAEVLNFLLFQHGDFKQRSENITKQIEAEKKAKESVVDAGAAKLATEAVLGAPVVSVKAPEGLPTPDGVK
jgi:hypothetical protein